MPKYKSPENDDVIKKSFEIFWSETKKKKQKLSWVSQSFDQGELYASQTQAIIKLIEKKEKDKRLIQNWRPILY